MLLRAWTCAAPFVRPSVHLPVQLVRALSARAAPAPGVRGRGAGAWSPPSAASASPSTSATAPRRRGERVPPFREVWRKFALKVHPDLFARWPELREQNADSLARLQGVLNEAKSSEGRCATSALRPRTETLSFFLKTGTDGAFVRVPLTLRIPGADCRHVLAGAFGGLFRAAGLPDRFDWGAEYWGSTYMAPSQAEDEDGESK